MKLPAASCRASWRRRMKLRRLGGIPVDRRSPQNLVEQLVKVFSTSDSLALAVPPEGTCYRALPNRLFMRIRSPISP